MIREFKDAHGMTVSVFLNNGTVYQYKDVPESPFGDNERYIAFWHEEKIMVFPMEQVEHIEFHDGIGNGNKG